MRLQNAHRVLSWMGLMAIGFVVFGGVPRGSAAIPDVPTGLSASDGTYSDKVALSWNAAAGATSYDMWRNTVNDGSTATKIFGCSGSPQEDTSATPGTIYYYWVQAKNASGVSAKSTVDTGYILSVPAVPTGLSASDGAYVDKVALSWNPASGATSYDMWRNTVNDSSTATKIFGCSGSPQDDSTVPPGTMYYYWVQAKNAAGVSAKSAVDSGYPAQTPAVPTGLSASEGVYSDKVALSWNAAAWATSYDMWRNMVNDSSTATKIFTCSGSPQEDTSATPGTIYYYWVQAKSIAGSSAKSSSDLGYAGSLSVPDVASGLTASDGAYSDKVTLSWNAAARATSYDMWRNTVNNSSTATKIFTCSGSPQEDTSATPGTIYYYWVQAKNGSGASAKSTGDTGYAGSLPQPSISGRVTRSDNAAGLDGVTVTLSNGGGSTTTSGGGYYTRLVSYSWTGTATPSYGDGSFSPAARTYLSPVTSNQENQNYTWYPEGVSRSTGLPWLSLLLGQ